MRFVWDEGKNRRNLSKHGVSFETATLVFDDPLHLSVQDRVVRGEERWQTIGYAGAVTLLIVAHAMHDEDEETIRIVSARRATSAERKRYEEAD